MVNEIKVLEALKSSELTAPELSELLEYEKGDIESKCEELYKRELVDFRRSGLPYQYFITKKGREFLDSNKN